MQKEAGWEMVRRNIKALGVYGGTHVTGDVRGMRFITHLVKLQAVAVKQIPKTSLTRAASLKNVLVYLWCC